MDDDVYDAIHAVITRNDALARDAIRGRLAQLTADQVRRKALNSSDRWIAIVALLEEEGRRFVATTAADVGHISYGSQAFVILEKAVQNLFQFLEETYIGAVNKVQGLTRTISTLQRTNDFIAGLWRPARERLDAEIAVGRAEFSQLYKEQRRDQREPPSIVKNKGGKPLAKHWDAMWAAIASDLFLGDLDPKTQADIERSMRDWLVDHNIEASPSTIRGRARALWQEIQDRS